MLPHNRRRFSSDELQLDESDFLSFIRDSLQLAEAHQLFWPVTVKQNNSVTSPEMVFSK